MTGKKRIVSNVSSADKENLRGWIKSKEVVFGMSVWSVEKSGTLTFWFPKDKEKEYLDHKAFLSQDNGPLLAEYYDEIDRKLKRRISVEASFTDCPDAANSFASISISGFPKACLFKRLTLGFGGSDPDGEIRNLFTSYWTFNYHFGDGNLKDYEMCKKWILGRSRLYGLFNDKGTFRIHAVAAYYKDRMRPHGPHRLVEGTISVSFFAPYENCSLVGLFTDDAVEWLEDKRLADSFPDCIRKIAREMGDNCLWFPSISVNRNSVRISFPSWMKDEYETRKLFCMENVDRIDFSFRDERLIKKSIHTVKVSVKDIPGGDYSGAITISRLPKDCFSRSFQLLKRNSDGNAFGCCIDFLSANTSCNLFMDRECKGVENPYPKMASLMESYRKYAVLWVETGENGDKSHIRSMPIDIVHAEEFIYGVGIFGLPTDACFRSLSVIPDEMVFDIMKLQNLCDTDMWSSELVRQGSILGLGKDVAPERLLLEAKAAKKICYYIGRPGTGKTTAIARQVAQLAGAEPEARILILSSENIAVDHLAEKISDEIFRLRYLKDKAKQAEFLRQCPSEVYITRSLRKVSDSKETDVPEKAIVAKDSTCVVKNIKYRIGKFNCFGQGIAATTFAMWEKGLADISSEKVPCWDYVVVEEASIAAVVDVYLAACYCRKRLFIVGDPNQLSSITESKIQDGKDVPSDIFSLLGIRYLRKGQARTVSPNREFDAQYRLPLDLDRFILEEFYPDIAGRQGYGGPGQWKRERERRRKEDMMGLPDVVSRNFPDAVNIWDVGGLRLHGAAVSLDKNKMAGKSSQQSHCNPISAAISVKLAQSIKKGLDRKKKGRVQDISLSSIHGIFSREDLEGASDCLDYASMTVLISRFMQTNTYNESNFRKLLKEVDEKKKPAKTNWMLSQEQYETSRSIGIITPYVAQTRLMTAMWNETTTDQGGSSGNGRPSISINTIHSYQGQEREVIIIDLVDTDPLYVGKLLKNGSPAAGSLGSLDRLLNVAISRAQAKCIIICDLAYFNDLKNYNRPDATGRNDQVSEIPRIFRDLDVLSQKGKKTVVEKRLMRFLISFDDSIGFWIQGIDVSKPRQSDDETALPDWSPECCRKAIGAAEGLWLAIGRRQTRKILLKSLSFDEGKVINVLIPKNKEKNRNVPLEQEMKMRNGIETYFFEDVNPFDLTCVFLRQEKKSQDDKAVVRHGIFIYGIVPDMNTRVGKRKSERQKRKVICVLPYIENKDDELRDFFIPRKPKLKLASKEVRREREGR